MIQLGIIHVHRFVDRLFGSFNKPKIRRGRLLCQQPMQMTQPVTALREQLLTLLVVRRWVVGFNLKLLDSLFQREQPKREGFCNLTHGMELSTELLHRGQGGITRGHKK